jgi:uncharacterized protein (DUF1697 family)
MIALLRAVNVGGNAKLAMSNLRAAAEKAGLKNVRSLLQSGNLVFDAGSRAPSAVEKLLETVCARSFGLKTDVYVRTDAELAALIEANPFPKEARSDPGHLLVLFLREEPDAAAHKALQGAIKGREQVRGGGRHAYITFPDGIGTSKLTSAFLARYLGEPGTGRNWNTVLKLADLAGK